LENSRFPELPETVLILMVEDEVGKRDAVGAEPALG
jgi:hypothetical protein